MKTDRQKRILIVDDEEVIRANLSEILKENGYFTDAAVSGIQAINKATSADFDVVLLDLMMPVMDGMETLKEIKKIRPKIKVIMITAFATVEGAVDAMKNGASDYVRKPYMPHELIATIQRTLEEARFESNLKKMNFEYAILPLSNPIRRDILLLLYSKGSKRFMDFVREFDMDDHTKLTFHINMLREHGLVEQGRRSYSLTPKGVRMVEFLRISEAYLSA
ncbi:MAG: response regulator [Nitrospirota bacterium]|jgi:DNA-binding response OmpR family regulator